MQFLTQSQKFQYISTTYPSSFIAGSATVPSLTDPEAAATPYN